VYAQDKGTKKGMAEVTIPYAQVTLLTSRLSAVAAARPSEMGTNYFPSAVPKSEIFPHKYGLLSAHSAAI